MDQRRTRGFRRARVALVAIAVVTLSLTAGWGSPPPTAPRSAGSTRSRRPSAALVDALRKGDDKALGAIFGPEGQRTRRRRATRWRTARSGSGSSRCTTSSTGSREAAARWSSSWGGRTSPFPIPLVAGRPVVALGHRRGPGGDRQPAHRPERAQHDPGVPRLRRRAARVLPPRPRQNGLLQYARTFASSPGKRDGLYWPTKEGEPPSPLGLFVARREAEGYAKRSSGPCPTGATTSGS